METLDKSSLPLAEERQGEVLSKGSATREGDKRLYIESYGCQRSLPRFFPVPDMRPPAIWKKPIWCF
jgi:hypothetical protein